MRIKSFQEFQKALADEPIAEPDYLSDRKVIMDKITASGNAQRKGGIPKKAVLVFAIIALLTFPVYIIAKNIINGIIELRGKEGDTLVKYIPRDEKWFEENKQKENARDDLRKVYADRIEAFKKQVGENQIGYLIIPLQSDFFVETVQENKFRHYNNIDLFIGTISQHKELPFVLPFNSLEGFMFLRGETRYDTPDVPLEQLHAQAVKKNMDQIIWTADIYDELVYARAEFVNGRNYIIFSLSADFGSNTVAGGTETEEIEHKGLRIIHLSSSNTDERYAFVINVQECDFIYEIRMNPGFFSTKEVIGIIDNIASQIDENRNNYAIEYNRQRDGLDYWLKRAKNDYITEQVAEGILMASGEKEDYAGEIEKIKSKYAEQIKIVEYVSEIIISNDKGAGFIAPLKNTDGTVAGYYMLHASKPDVYESFDEFERHLADMEFNLPLPRNIPSGFSFCKASVMYDYLGRNSYERSLNATNSWGYISLDTIRQDKVYSAKQEYGADTGDRIYFGVFAEEPFNETRQSGSVRVGDCDVKIYESDTDTKYQFEMTADGDVLTYQIVCSETMKQNQVVEMIRDLLEQ